VGHYGASIRLPIRKARFLNKRDDDYVSGFERMDRKLVETCASRRCAGAAEDRHTSQIRSIEAYCSMPDPGRETTSQIRAKRGREKENLFYAGGGGEIMGPNTLNLSG
jgi:hypothetical protein